VSLDGRLSAEGADVFGVLGDFHLLDLLSEGGTVSVIQRNKLSALRSNSIFKLMRVVRTLMALQGEEFVNCRLEHVPVETRVRWKGANTYLVPYLPVTPTFLVLFVILAEVAVMNGD
jgi:hypothetical protein